MSTNEETIQTAKVLRRGTEEALKHGLLRLPARVVVVDGSNVAYAVQTSAGKPRIELILVIREKLLEYSFIPICLVSANLKYHINNPNLFQELLRQEIIIESPAGVSDDRFLIAVVREFDSLILTNDLFRDILAPHDIEWFIQRRIAFKFILNTPVLLFPQTIKINKYETIDISNE
ncbi:MAG: hypothetical protein ACFFDI_01185 [Promethearchaeota archaeon]